MGLLPTQRSPGIRYCAHGGSKDKGSRRSHESAAVRIADLVVQTETLELFSVHCSPVAWASGLSSLPRGDILRQQVQAPLH